MPKEKPQIVLEGSLRRQAGKGSTRLLRGQGWVPGVIYGQGQQALAIQVSARELGRILQSRAGGNALITLRVQEGQESAVLMKELQRHPVSHEVVHVDFHRVSLTKRITVSVPLAFKGESRGVRQEGGILEHLRWDLEVECLPTQIPAEIPVEVSNLALGDTLHAKKVPMPEGARLVTDGELPVAACVAPRAEEVPAAAEAEAAEGEEPEVLKQKKPEEIAAEAQAQEKAKPQEKAKAPEPEKGKEEKK